MEKVSKLSGCKAGCALAVLAVAGAQLALAAPSTAPKQKVDCKLYEQQAQANLEVQRQADPSLRAAHLDTVFYSVKRQACLASVFFTRGVMTYAGIVDLSDHETLWAKSYKGTNFTPAHVLAMEAEMDEAIQGIELETAAATTPRATDLLPLFFDRTINTLPANENALTESH